MDQKKKKKNRKEKESVLNFHIFSKFEKSCKYIFDYFYN